MSKFISFQQNIASLDMPAAFANPYGYDIDELSKFAMKSLQQQLENSAISHDFFHHQPMEATDGIDHPTEHPFHASHIGGRRFGVLIVKNKDNDIGYLQAFQHSLAGQWQYPSFVECIIDEQQRQQACHHFASSLQTCYDAFKSQNQPNNRQINSEKALKQLNKHYHEQLETLATVSENPLVIKREKRRLFQTWKQQSRRLKADIQNGTHEHDNIKQNLADTYRQINQFFFDNLELFNGIDKATVSSLLADHDELLHFYQDGVDMPLPKLLHYAFSQQFTPISFAEFWWGCPPKGKVFHHQHHYAVSRRVCKPLLSFLLKYVPIRHSTKAAQPFVHKPILANNSLVNKTHIPSKQSLNTLSNEQEMTLSILYEDDDILAINKPAGVLSVPGVNTKDSVYQVMLDYRTDLSGPIIVHRLDLATSGILLLAKHKQAHQHLQQQFILRTIHKRYSAILTRPIDHHQSANDEAMTSLNNENTINLPLVVDYKDRPKQMISDAHGKPAITYWQYQTSSDGVKQQPKVWLYPKTGRTHQLRVHCAYHMGLNAPILGDALYGFNDAARLMLHAERIQFQLFNQETIKTLTCPSPF